MNTDTGEILHFEKGQLIPSGFTPLTAKEHQHLKGVEKKSRMAALKRLRKNAIRAAKRALGRRLTTEEVIEVLEPLKQR